MSLAVLSKTPAEVAALLTSDQVRGDLLAGGSILLVTPSEDLSHDALDMLAAELGEHVEKIARASGGQSVTLTNGLRVIAASIGREPHRGRTPTLTLAYRLTSAHLTPIARHQARRDSNHQIINLTPPNEHHT